MNIIPVNVWMNEWEKEWVMHLIWIRKTVWEPSVCQGLTVNLLKDALFTDSSEEQCTSTDEKYLKKIQNKTNQISLPLDWQMTGWQVPCFRWNVWNNTTLIVITLNVKVKEAELICRRIGWWQAFVLKDLLKQQCFRKPCQENNWKRQTCLWAASHQRQQCHAKGILIIRCVSLACQSLFYSFLVILVSLYLWLLVGIITFMCENNRTLLATKGKVRKCSQTKGIMEH